MTGLSHDDAGKRMVDMADPEKQRQREALLKSDHVQKRVKKIDVAEVRDIYDPGLFGFDPDLGPNEAARATMLADYKDMFEESVVESAGDLELAKELATQRFQRLYAPSALTLEGSGVITRLPPERTYPAGPDGTHGYIGQQVEEALKAEGVEADRVFLKYYDQTEIDYEAGRPARYEVWYEQGGQLKLYNLPFYADPEAAEQQWLDERRERHQENRNDANRKPLLEFGRPSDSRVIKRDTDFGRGPLAGPGRPVSRLFTGDGEQTVISPDGSKRVISE